MRPGLLEVGDAADCGTVCGALYMIKDDRVLTFGDAAVPPEPTPSQLADIALVSARERRLIVGDEPIVAFLSFSTCGSAAGPRVQRVQEAVAALRRRLTSPPEFAFDGELQ